MALPGWVKGWMTVSTLLCVWDCGFILSRPKSFPGNEWGALWPAYDKYTAVDKKYLDLENGFVKCQFVLCRHCISLGIPLLFFLCCQACMTLFEVALGVYALLAPTSRKQWFWLLVVNTMVFWKTILFYGADAFEGFREYSHVSRLDFWSIFLGPGLLWVILPFFIMRRAVSELLPESNSKKDE